MNSQTTAQDVQFPETERFLAWYRAAKIDGLKDIKFCTVGADRATVESFFAEVNRAIASQEVEDGEVF